MKSDEQDPVVSIPETGTRKKLDLSKWIGSRKDSLAELGYKSVDDFIDDIRGPVDPAFQPVRQKRD